MKRDSFYSIDQCALYKLGSKVRLAKLLHISVHVLLELSKSPKYRVFSLDEEICPFTGKKTKGRLVQAPAEALRPIHDRILDLTRWISPPHYAHAAVKSRSYRTNADVHKSNDEVATFDITSFYTFTSGQAVYHFFHSQMKCAPDIAGILTKLVCFTPKLGKSHLPTGSPLSPILSVYANKPLFDSINFLATTHGLLFTCYVDDLTFSGKKIPYGFENQVSSLVKKHGHSLAVKKTRIFSVDDSKHITGTVIFRGQLTVPYSRFYKARKIRIAIASASDVYEKLRLMRILSGLLGEAAFLDPRYKSMAASSYKRMSDTSRGVISFSTSAVSTFQPNPAIPDTVEISGSSEMENSLPF